MDGGTLPILLVIAASEAAAAPRGRCVTAMVRGGISSLMRSLYSGRIIAFRNGDQALFKIERKGLDEVILPTVPMINDSLGSLRRAGWEFVSHLCGQFEVEARQWVMVADAASLALRNIDHLLPPDSPGPYGPPEVDFCWAETDGNNGVTPGLWAARGEHLPLILARWKEAWSKERGAESASEIEIWRKVVLELPLRKKPFENGEVVAPRIGAVDWEAVSSAAFVTVPDWPEKEAWQFLQALYFGTYLGDESGMMLNILEP